MKGEDALLYSVCEYLRCQYPQVFWCHIANERKTSPAMGAKLKKLGVRAGMPDLLIFYKKYHHCGLAIELKYGKNKPTLSQHFCLNQLLISGWKTAIVYEFDEAKRIIDNYFRNII